MILEVLTIFITSLLLTALAVPLTIRFAHRFNLIDDPNINPHPKKIHTRIIPRAGGLAIYVAIIICSLLFLSFNKALLGIFIGITILLIMGLVDDRKIEFSPYTRLFLLFAAAFCAVGAGIGISFVTNPFYSIGLFTEIFPQSIIHLDKVIIPFNFIGQHQIVLLADILALIWIVALTQIINWSKGVDGQMPGITFITSLTLALLSMKLFNAGDIHQLGVARLALIVCGASLGFLIFNWHPAKIFPGFSGSTILAFMLAVLSILSGAKLATVFLVLAIPTVDFLFTLTRRVLKGRSPVWGDRGHLHHHLLDLGWSHRQISLFYMSVSAMLGAVALLVGSTSKFYVLILAGAISLGFILWLNSFGDLSKPPDPDNG